MPTRRARGDPGRGASDGIGAPRADAAAPDPIAEPLHRTALHLLRLLRRADDASGVSPARLSALSVLVFGGPTTLGRLAGAEGVSAPTMSRLVTELEREGWLRRAADPADARIVRLEATPAARRLLHAGRGRRLRALTDALAGISGEDRTRLTAALPALQRLVVTLADAPRSTRTHASRPGPAARSKRRFD